MRIFATVAELGSFTAASRRLGLPKQTVSRRVAVLEQVLGAKLLERSTRRVTLTPSGELYARKCTQLVELAQDANRGLNEGGTPSGTLRLTADPHFGRLFPTDVILEFARTWPKVRVDAEFTSRRVDLHSERFDLAFRIGQIVDASLVARSLGLARMRYCASPEYLHTHGAPASPWDLDRHRCVALSPQPGPALFVFSGPDGTALSVEGHFRTNQPELARSAALQGMGIVNLPEFFCVPAIAEGRLVPVLDDHVGDHGHIFVALPSPRANAPPRAQAFLACVDVAFGNAPPWEVPTRISRRTVAPKK